MIHGASCDWVRLANSRGTTPPVSSAPYASKPTKGRKVPKDITATATRTTPAGSTSTSLGRRNTRSSSTSSGAWPLRVRAVTCLLDIQRHAKYKCEAVAVSVH